MVRPDTKFAEQSPLQPPAAWGWGGGDTRASQKGSATAGVAFLQTPAPGLWAHGHSSFGPSASLAEIPRADNRSTHDPRDLSLQAHQFSRVTLAPRKFPQNTACLPIACRINSTPLVAPASSLTPQAMLDYLYFLEHLCSLLPLGCAQVASSPPSWLAPGPGLLPGSLP